MGNFLKSKILPLPWFNLRYKYFLYGKTYNIEKIVDSQHESSVIQCPHESHHQSLPHQH